MADFFNDILGFLSGVFGIVLGMAYFLPIIVLVVALAIAAYLHRRRGQHTVFSAEEPGEEAEHHEV